MHKSDLGTCDGSGYARRMTHTIPAWVKGRLTPVEKLEVHLKGLRHKAVSVFVMAGDQILIQQRAKEKYHTPELWANTCCTHPLWDEDARDCAIRRLEQELGIIGVSPVYRHTVEYRADVGNGMTEHEVAEVFVVDADLSLNVAPNPEEVMATRWISRADLAREVEAAPDRFTPWLRIYLAEHSTAIFGDFG